MSCPLSHFARLCMSQHCSLGGDYQKDVSPTTTRAVVLAPRLHLAPAVPSLSLITAAVTGLQGCSQAEPTVACTPRAWDVHKTCAGVHAGGRGRARLAGNAVFARWSGACAVSASLCIRAVYARRACASCGGGSARSGCEAVLDGAPVQHGAARLFQSGALGWRRGASRESGGG